MHKRDKVAGLLLTAGKVNSLQKAQISSLSLRRSSAVICCVIALCTLNGQFGALTLTETAVRWASRVKAN